ncbi:MAG: DUF4417 domain-containing protein [Actinobacteria bacterium]|nr:DUF4417 domain-containing protein [Actinomycetota bacterium]
MTVGTFAPVSAVAVSVGTARLAPARGCDCSVCPFFVGDPGRGIAPGVEPVCSGSSSSCSYCGCARAEGEGHSLCGQCPIRCGSRPDIGAWMADVGGTLAFDDLVLDLELPSGLPGFIPQVDGHDVAAFDADLHWPAYGVGLRRVFSLRTRRVYPKFEGEIAREALGLGADQLAVLVGYGTDPLVEAFWTHRHALIEALAAQRWDLVLAPNYSMYGNQPRAEHLLNFRRNLLIATEMVAAGVPAVPNIYWFRLEDLDRYLAWFDDTRPAAMAINLQTFRTEEDWETMALPGLTYLSLGIPEDLAVIVTGSSRSDRIATLLELFGDRRLHLVSQNAQAYARHGAVMTDSGRVDRQARVEDLFAANVRHYARLLEANS